MAGTFDVDGPIVRFRPRHPFIPGITYRWLLRDEPTTELRIELTSPERTPTAEATAVYPSAPELPFNLLRLYIHFSAPMSDGFAARAVWLEETATGRRLEDAILAIEPELWDLAHRRLTVLLDPGRIKRGLVPNAQAGYPLHEGMTVDLVVDLAMLDASGTPLRAGWRRSYEIGPAERRRVIPAEWRIERPPPRSTAPLVVHFDRPLDHALLNRCLRVLDGAGSEIAGQAEVPAGEVQWRFSPDREWAPGRYTLTVAPELEDVAGNSVIRVFDRDLARPDDDPLDGASVGVEFTM